MFSLRVAIILALVTRFDNNAVYGYSVDIPFTVTVDEPTVESNNLLESTSPCPETANNPVIENPAIPTLEIGDQTNAVASAQFAVLQQNFNISQPGRKGKKKSCICQECNPENGFFIKHFRQYNYYYPFGHKTSLPMQYSEFSSEEPSDDQYYSLSMVGNNNGRVSARRSTKSRVKYNMPGVASQVPNKDFNNINNQVGSGIRQNVAVNDRDQTFDEGSSENDEAACSEESEDGLSVPTQDDEFAASNPSDDNINEDIINYISDPNFYGHTRKTVIKNGNNQYQSQQISISSRTQSQSQPLPSDYESQQQDGILSNMQSQSLQGYGQQQQDGLDMNRINMQSQYLPSSESQQQQYATSSSMQSQSSSGYGQQQQDRVSSNTQSQPLSGYGQQQQDGLDMNRIRMQSQSVPSYQSQQQYATSSSMQSQSSSGSAVQQQDSISSNMQSQPLPNSESQQQVQISSSIMQSQPMSNYGTSINLASDSNFDGQNRMTSSDGYNPYFQQSYGMPQPQLTGTGFQNPMDWLGGSTANAQINQQNSFQYFNPVRSWSNTLPPSQFFDLPNMSPSYSVMI